MAAEENDEHRAGSRHRPTHTIMDAAGYLCALLLLSGEEGYSLPPIAAPPHAVALTELDEPPGRLSQEDLEYSLHTTLFTASSEGVLTPMHRQVAEFLAGRYLARLIDGALATGDAPQTGGGTPTGGGLPARRVIALMASETDKRVVDSAAGSVRLAGRTQPRVTPTADRRRSDGCGPIRRYRCFHHPREETTVEVACGVRSRSISAPSSTPV